ncbi:27931_t:CDS:2, partial [Dentiscutata erythropus]
VNSSDYCYPTKQRSEMDDIKIIHVSTTEEQNECYKIRTEIFVKEQNCNPANELDEYDKSSSCHHFLALKSSLPIGTVRIHPYPSPTSTTEMYITCSN